MEMETKTNKKEIISVRDQTIVYDETTTKKNLRNKCKQNKKKNQLKTQQITVKTV